MTLIFRTKSKLSEKYRNIKYKNIDSYGYENIIIYYSNGKNTPRVVFKIKRYCG